MNIDLAAARGFMAAHARILDRRRFELVTGKTDTSAVLAALRAYRNPDGGYGYGLEPDLRAPESQPAAALHAFEVFAEIAPEISPEAPDLCDWLDVVSRPDGGLPFAVPIEDPSGCALFFACRPTCLLAGDHCDRDCERASRRCSRPGRRRPSLARPSDGPLPGRDQALESVPEVYVLAFAVRLLDSVCDREPSAPALLARLAQYIPDDGKLCVGGGLPDEALYPIDLAPEPGQPARGILDERLVSDDLERLAREQRNDGGWAVDFQSYSPAAALEWRAT